MQRLHQVSVHGRYAYATELMILPVEEWINWTDGIKGYNERQNSLCACSSWWNQIICPL